MQANKQATDVSRIAVIYCRVSGDGQRDNYSLDTQEEACRELCAAEGLTVLTVLREVHSGADWERPIFQDALDYLRRGEAGVIVVHALDRFMRDQDANVYAMYEIEQRLGARAVSALEKLGDSAEDKLLRGIYGYLSEKERQKIAERTSRGRKARVERDGLPLPGPFALYGYQWVYETRPDGRQRKTRLVEDPTTAPIVQRIFREVLQGASLRSIARGLDSDGILTPSRGRRESTRHPVSKLGWSRGSILKMLNDPRYMGTAEAYSLKRVKRKTLDETTGRHKITYTVVQRPPEERIALPTDSCPALVSVEDWQAAQARLKQNRADAGRNTRWPKDQLLRAGIAVCGYCERSMHVKHPNGRNPQAYICGARYQSEPCPGNSPSVAVDILDSDIWGKVITLLTTNAVQLALARREVDADGGSGNIAEQRLTREIATHDGLIADQEKKLKNLLRMQAEADDDEAYGYAKNQAEEVRARLGRLRTDRAELLGQRDSLAQTARIAEHLLMGLPGGTMLTLPIRQTITGDPLADETVQAALRMMRGEGTPEDEERLDQSARDIRESLASHIETHWSVEDKRAVLRWLGVQVEVTRKNDPQPPEGKHWRVSFSLEGVLADPIVSRYVEGRDEVGGMVVLPVNNEVKL